MGHNQYLTQMEQWNYQQRLWEYIYTWIPLDGEKYPGVENNETLQNPSKIISMKTNDLLQPNASIPQQPQ